ncbi:MAG: transferase [Glaciimonas sp.]|nr:transferase [Glaciimonas sp.]
MIRHFVNIILWLLPPSRLFTLRRFLLRLGGVHVPKSVCFCGRGWIYGRGVVAIGVDTWLSPGVVIHSHVEAPVVVGERCDIGPGVEFIPGSHIIGASSRRAGMGTANPISIGNGCWLGAKSIILGGVSIGDGCIVAAGAVVTDSVPPNTLVAGIPARFKRQ